MADTILLDSYGIWSIESLGYSCYDFPCAEDIETSSPIEYYLPGNASQGPDDWYIIHLDLKISISDQSDAGRCYVSAMTNGFACAQIKFETRTSNDALIVDWSSVDLVNGGIHGSTSSNHIDISFENYLQISGVKPGANQLTFKLEQYEDVKIDSLKISESSGIEYTKASPPELVLGVNIPDDKICTGDIFIVDFQVNNLGDTPAKNVEIVTECSDDSLQLLESHSTTVESLDTLLNGSFKYTAREEGTHYITIFVETKSGINCSPMNIKVPVSSSLSSPSLLLISVSIASTVLLLIIAKKLGGKLIKMLRRQY